LNIELGWTSIGVIVSILLHCSFTIWWASKITNQILNLNICLNRLDKELEKRDAQISAAWSKIDDHAERITRLESNNH